MRFSFLLTVFCLAALGCAKGNGNSGPATENNHPDNSAPKTTLQTPPAPTNGPATYQFNGQYKIVRYERSQKDSSQSNWSSRVEEVLPDGSTDCRWGYGAEAMRPTTCSALGLDAKIESLWKTPDCDLTTPSSVGDLERNGAYILLNACMEKKRCTEAGECGASRITGNEFHESRSLFSSLNSFTEIKVINESADKTTVSLTFDMEQPGSSYYRSIKLKYVLKRK